MKHIGRATSDLDAEYDDGLDGLSATHEGADRPGLEDSVEGLCITCDDGRTVAGSDGLHCSDHYMELQDEAKDL